MVKCLNRKKEADPANGQRESISADWIYQQLNLPDTILDSGYSQFRGESEYAQGKGDGCVEPAEVYRYLFGHASEYVGIIKTLTGSLPSFVLDDFDAGTDRDKKIRDKTDRTILALKDILKSRGYLEGTDAYQEMLALGLFYFVYFPTQMQISYRKRLQPKSLEKLAKDAADSSLPDFASYFLKNGGLGVVDMAGDAKKEMTALEAIYAKNADCTERSKILYAVFLQA
ncbi:MAG: hypothetical protein HY877_08195, partial [Deltaproteobacteria bacterium]|nr:hypothetical protein [Deltaproteobacteria bacterium]